MTEKEAYRKVIAELWQIQSDELREVARVVAEQMPGVFVTALEGVRAKRSAKLVNQHDENSIHLGRYKLPIADARRLQRTINGSGMIAAIKDFRSLTNSGLKEGKDAIDELKTMDLDKEIAQRAKADADDMRSRLIKAGFISPVDDMKYEGGGSF